MSWGLVFRALRLRGGLVWLVVGRYRLLPRRMPGPGFLTRSVLKLNARRQGRSDGKLGLPTAAQMSSENPDYPAHLMYLKNQGDGFVRAILESIQCVGTRKRGRSAATSQVRQLLDRARDERTALAEVEQRLRLSKARLEARRKDLVLNQKALVRAKERRRAADLWSRGLRRSTYTVLLVFFTVAELPLLALAFQNFFSVGFSVIVSLGVSVAIIFCAHVAGVLLAKREAVLLPGDARILTAILAGVLATIVGLSFVRELYLKTSGQDGVSTGPTWVVVVVFAIFNIMVFGAAVLLSKFRHSEHTEAIGDAKPAVRNARRELKRARKADRTLRKEAARIQARIILLDGLAWSTAQRVYTSIEQARFAASGEKDFIEKCYALYARENARSQAYWAARRARLRRPLESGPIPAFNRLPEVADPAIEFRPLEEQVRAELPLEELRRPVAAVDGPLQATPRLSFGEAH
jgi:hypothetical protein